MEEQTKEMSKRLHIKSGERMPKKKIEPVASAASS
jgi:hypothetical protein